MKQHPRSQDILTVIRNFEKVLPMAKRNEQLNMGETNCCGTIHCHSGWYGAATFSAIRKFFSGGYISYLSGGRKLANHLGFYEIHILENWAECNREVWGNYTGRWMFSSASAFYHPTNRPNGAQSLQHIVDHWKEVYARVKALEDAEQDVNTVVATPVTIKAHNRIGSAPSELTKIDVGDRIDVMREKLDVIINEVKI